MATISTHVLDVSLGRPAASVGVRLQRRDGTAWTDVSRAATNDDGRVAALMPADAPAAAGAFRLTFDVGAYFKTRGVESFYDVITIDFIVRDPASHYHVPLLVSPFGYTTYRGS